MTLLNELWGKKPQANAKPEAAKPVVGPSDPKPTKRQIDADMMTILRECEWTDELFKLAAHKMGKRSGGRPKKNAQPATV